MGRIIGIQHRTKRTAAGEARPTMVYIYDMITEASSELELEDETSELDFARGQYPESWRRVEENEDIKRFPLHHVEMKKVEDGQVPYKVPASYNGLQHGDAVVMLLGGSGDRLAYALARNGEKVGAAVWRVPAFNLTKDGEKPDGQHVRLVSLYLSAPQAFRQVGRRDMKVMLVSEQYRLRMDAMRARIGCEQRLRQRSIGAAFFTEGDYPEGLLEDRFDAIKASDKILDGLLTEERRRNSELEKAVQSLDIWEDIFADIRGCGVSIVSGLVAGIGNVSRFLRSEEMAELLDNRRKIQVLDAKSNRNSYAEKIELVEGENHFQRTARIRQLMLQDGHVDEAEMLKETLRLMQRNSDIRRIGANRFKAFCGVHLINGWAECGDCAHQFDTAKHTIELGCPKCHGSNVTPKAIFARRRAGVVANWHPAVRQALYLLGDQFNRRPDTEWGQRQRSIKVELHKLHPAPVKIGTVTRYTPGHLHKTATWRTLSRFTEWLFNRWLDVELKAAQAEKLEV